MKSNNYTLQQLKMWNTKTNNIWNCIK